MRGPVARASEALKLVDAAALDAAVLDVNLRGETSLSVAEALAERSIPFAFMPGYVSSAVPVGFKARPVLNKPINGANSSLV